MPNITLNSFGVFVITGAKISTDPATIYNNIINKPKYNINLENEKRFDMLSIIFLLLRRERDSNPRYPFEAYTLSRRAPSTTRTSLQY